MTKTIAMIGRYLLFRERERERERETSTLQKGVTTIQAHYWLQKIGSMPKPIRFGSKKEFSWKSTCTSVVILIY